MHATLRLIATVVPGALVLAGATVVPGGSAAGGTAPTVATVPACDRQDGGYSPTSIDDDAVSDIVVGVPGSSAGGLARAGAVDVHLGQRDRTRVQRFDEGLFGSLARPAADDAFGSSLAFMHLGSSSVGEGDCADLAIGAPGADNGRGQVIIALGSNDGVSPTGAIRLQGQTPNERFGYSVVADGDDVWIGAPYRDAHGVLDSGAVDHYRVDAAQGTATLVQTLNENTYGIHGGPEAYDHFGQHLDVSYRGPLVIGEPGEDVGTHAVDAGTVTVVFDRMSATGQHGLLRKSWTYSQNSPSIPGGAETGDHFGASVSSQRYGFYGSSQPTHLEDRYTLGVGVPGEAIGRLGGAGIVDTITVRSDHGDAGFVSALSQGTRGVPGDSQANDQFGKQVALIGRQLCIGIPGENATGVIDAGRVLCSPLDSTTNSPYWTTYRQGGLGDPDGKPQRGAAFGSQLSRVGDNFEGDSEAAGGERVFISAPGAGSPNSASGEVLVQRDPVESDVKDFTLTDSGGPVTSERYGVPASAGSNGEVS